MKCTIYILAILLFSMSVSAVTLQNNTVFKSVGLNLTFNVTYPLTLQQLYIAENSIYFTNVSSNTDQTITVYNATFNITLENRSYTTRQLPYLVNYTNSVQIIHDLDGTVNVTFALYDYNCTHRVFNYTSAANTYNRQYLETHYTCANDTLIIEVQTEKGVNILGYKYRKFVSLIDEITNAPLVLTSVESAKLYYDNNYTLFDFKTANTTYVNFTNLAMAKVRLEVGYSDGTIITRYIDLDLLATDVTLCANAENNTHYEQLITSATEKPVILKNTYSRCLIAADYTRFAYQNSKVLKAFSVAKLYQLITFDSDDQQIDLASVDGSIASYINIDTLEFYRDANTLDLTTESLTTSERNANEVTLFYLNQDDDNDKLNIQIVRTDTNALVYNSSSYGNPNAATIIFNHGSLSNVSDETLFKVTVKTTKDTGDVNTFYRYFSPRGSVGSINPVIIAVVSILLLMFGLSFTITQTSFGWFGILFQVINMGILTLALSTWYIQFLMGVNAIVLIYIVLVLIAKNKATIG